MADENILLEIENLRINFYTYQGVVKALDGINLKINKAETLGLVGETGCGKSVTASSITKLILSPPGKIEEGSIFFLEPSEVRKKRKQFEAEYQEAYDKLSESDKKKAAAQYGPRETGFKKRVKKITEEEITNAVPLKIAPSKLTNIYLSKKAASVPKTEKTIFEALSRTYDLLPKSNEYMQQIRGKYISMIFQEPASALNPVFMAGDQIAEVVLLHRKVELAKRIRLRMDKEIELFEKQQRPRRIGKNVRGCPECGAKIDVEVDECKTCHTNLHSDRSGKLIKIEKIFECSICHSRVDSQDRWCDSCGNKFYNFLAWRIRPISLRSNRRLFEAIEKNPKSRYINLLGRIPILNQFTKELHEEGMREAVKMLEIVRIPDPKGVAYRYPHELSGGMQQRVMIAIALACNPRLLIADEPTTALDVTIQAQILKLMRDMKTKFGSSILLITHNLGVVAEMCDRVGVMYAGTMAEIGDVHSIFKKPLHPYTVGLMSAVPSVQLDAERLFTIRGNVPNLVRPPSGCRFNPRCDFAKNFCSKVKPELIEIEPGHFVACHKVSGAVGYV